MFNPRIFFGTVAAAGVLAASAAMPAFAAGGPAGHRSLSPIDVVGTAFKTGQAVGENIPASSALNGASADGLLGALSGVPLIGPLISAFPALSAFSALSTGATGATGAAGGTADGNPVTGVPHGASAGTGLSSMTSGVGGTVGGTTGPVAKTVPGGSTVTGLMPGLTAGTVGGALSGISNAVPAAGSITSTLLEAGG